MSSTKSQTTQIVRVSDPREVFAAIAYRLGFHPRESIVVVSLQGERRKMGLVARVDLLDVDQAATALAEHLARDGAGAVLVVAYTGDGDQAHDGTVFVDDALAAAGITLAGVWWVTGTDYRAINPQRPQDCPRTGRALDLDLDTTIIAATMVSTGASAVATREDLAITAAGHDARALAAQAGAAWTAEATPTARAVGLGLWREALTTEPTPQVAGRLAAALTDVLVRDAVLCDVIGDHDVAPSQWGQMGLSFSDTDDEPAAEHGQAGDSEPKPAVRGLTTEPSET